MTVHRDEGERKPTENALWSSDINTRFGTDYVWLEPANLMTGGQKVYLCLNVTTDPIDGFQRTDILLNRDELIALMLGCAQAINWLDQQTEDATS